MFSSSAGKIIASHGSLTTATKEKREREKERQSCTRTHQNGTGDEDEEKGDEQESHFRETQSGVEQGTKDPRRILSS